MRHLLCVILTLMASHAWCASGPTPVVPSSLFLDGNVNSCAVPRISIPHTAAFTIAGWVKAEVPIPDWTTDITVSNPPITSIVTYRPRRYVLGSLDRATNSGNTFAVQYSHIDQRFVFEIASQFTYPAPNSAALSVWHHVAITITPSINSLPAIRSDVCGYVDGARVMTRTGVLASGGAFNLDYFGTTRPYNHTPNGEAPQVAPLRGNLAKWATWGVALTDADVAALYNGGTFVEPATVAGPLSHSWRFGIGDVSYQIADRITLPSAENRPVAAFGTLFASFLADHP